MKRKRYLLTIDATKYVAYAKDRNSAKKKALAIWNKGMPKEYREKNIDDILDVEEI